MLVENKKTQKICCIYVSDFHLEMILVPYIKQKMKENENIIIQTERNLNKTIEILISRLNLKEEEKLKIINIGWDKKEKELKNNSNIIIIGTKKYIEQINAKIKNNNVFCKNILDCYNFDEIKENIETIICKYNKSLNTLGYN